MNEWKEKYLEKANEIEDIKVSFEELKRNIIVREEVIELSHRESLESQNNLRRQLEEHERLLEEAQNEIDILQTENRTQQAQIAQAQGQLGSAECLLREREE